MSVNAPSVQEVSMRREVKQYLVDLAVTIFILLLVLGWVASKVKAHEVDGWMFPPECCSDGDCDIATKVTYLEGGGMEITTKYGTEVYPQSFPRRSSPNEAIFACHVNGRKYCLFVPAGS